VKSLPWLFLFCAVPAWAGGAMIFGGGSDFSFPMFAACAHRYAAEKRIRVNYQPMGAAAGEIQIKKGTLEFAVTHRPWKEEDLERYGFMQVPVLAGGIVPVVNVPGVKVIVKMTPDLLARIFLGQVKDWNDPEIVKLNPDLHLPARKIQTVVRSDGSGLTYALTKFLSSANEDFKAQIHAHTNPEWPAGTAAQKGNMGVAGMVQQAESSISYVDYPMSKLSSLNTVALVDDQGKTIRPGDEEWPMKISNYVLIPKNSPQKEVLMQFLDYMTFHCQETAVQLGYQMLGPQVEMASKAPRESHTE
jgi:phosphate transport system substrate-binding protein